MRKSLTVKILLAVFSIAPNLAIARVDILTNRSTLVGDYRSEAFHITVPEAETQIGLSADHFDAILLIVDANGVVKINDDNQSDDPRLGNLDSAITIEKPGRYVAIVTSYNNSGRGKFEFIVPDSVTFQPLQAASTNSMVDPARRYLLNPRMYLSEARNTSGTLSSLAASTSAMTSIDRAAGSVGARLTDISLSASRTEEDPCSPQDSSNVVNSESELEQLFPWPPPDATDRLVLVRSYFANASTLRDVSDVLSAALKQNGYSGLGYWGVGDSGFAVVTKMEQTDHKGHALVGNRRFMEEIAHVKRWTLEGVLRSLVLAEPGYYRTIVFLVTDLKFNEEPSSCTQEIVEEWANRGANLLSPRVEMQSFSEWHNVTALVYEFSKNDSADDPEVQKFPKNNATVHLAEIIKSLD